MGHGFTTKSTARVPQWCSRMARAAITRSGGSRSLSFATAIRSWHSTSPGSAIRTPAAANTKLRISRVHRRGPRRGRHRAGRSGGPVTGRSAVAQRGRAPSGSGGRRHPRALARRHQQRRDNGDGPRRPGRGREAAGHRPPDEQADPGIRARKGSLPFQQVRARSNAARVPNLRNQWVGATTLGQVEDAIAAGVRVCFIAGGDDAVLRPVMYRRVAELLPEARSTWSRARRTRCTGGARPVQRRPGACPGDGSSGSAATTPAPPAERPSPARR